MGIDTERMFALGWGIGRRPASAWPARCSSIFFYVFPDVGAVFALLAYVTVALGGFGNVAATLLAGGRDRPGRGARRALGARVQVRRRLRPLPPGRPLAAPGPLRTVLMRRRIRGRLALLALGLAAVLVPSPGVFTQPYPRDVMIRIFLYAMLAPAWNLLGGLLRPDLARPRGVLRHRRLHVVGAVAEAWGVSPWLGMLARAWSLAVLVSQADRLSGASGCAATTSPSPPSRSARSCRPIVINWDAIGGARGLCLPIKPDTLVNFQFHQAKRAYYYVALALLAAVLGLTAFVERSRSATTSAPSARTRTRPAPGRPAGPLQARGDGHARPPSPRWAAPFYAQYVLFIDPSPCCPTSLSILVCLVAVLGGVGTLWGPALGAAVLIPLSETTRVWLGGTGKAVDLMIYGALDRPRLGLPARRPRGPRPPARPPRGRTGGPDAGCRAPGHRIAGRRDGSAQRSAGGAGQARSGSALCSRSAA